MTNPRNYRAGRRLATIVVGAGLLAGAVSLGMTGRGAAETAVALPPPTTTQTVGSGASPKTAVLAGGCFWGVQAVFQHVNGVSRVVSGYAGGARETAHYGEVGTGRTGHAESVEITYDPQVIDYGTLLQIYFSVAHDPTQLNRQGPDRGTQYRSTIFAMNGEQAAIARDYIAQLDKARVFEQPIATSIASLEEFYPAESYHQDYATLLPENPYIAYNDLPKVENLSRLFPQLYRQQPRLVSEAGLAD